MVVKYLMVLNYSIFLGGVKYEKNKRRWRT